jgi:amino acid transporter
MIYHAIAGNEGTVPEWSFKITAAVVVILISLLNLISPTAGTHSQVVLTAIKIGSLVFVGVLGIIYLIRHGPGPAFTGNIFAGSSQEPGSYATALYLGLWAFDGWDQCSVGYKLCPV